MSSNMRRSIKKGGRPPKKTAVEQKVNPLFADADGSLCAALGERDCTTTAATKKTCQWVKEHTGRGGKTQAARCQRKAVLGFTEEGKEGLAALEAREEARRQMLKEQVLEEKRQAALDLLASQSPKPAAKKSRKAAPKKASPKKASPKKASRKPARPSSCGLNAKGSHCVSGVLPDEPENCAVNEETNRCHKVKRA